MTELKNLCLNNAKDKQKSVNNHDMSKVLEMVFTLFSQLVTLLFSLVVSKEHSQFYQFLGLVGFFLALVGCISWHLLRFPTEFSGDYATVHNSLVGSETVAKIKFTKKVLVYDMVIPWNYTPLVMDSGSAAVQFIMASLYQTTPDLKLRVF